MADVVAGDGDLEARGESFRSPVGDEGFWGGEVFAEPTCLSESFLGAGSASEASSSCIELGLVI